MVTTAYTKTEPVQIVLFAMVFLGGNITPMLVAAAFASEMWFLAFLLEGPTHVRALGLVEILIAGIISRGMFLQASGIRDIIACFWMQPGLRSY